MSINSVIPHQIRLFLFHYLSTINVKVGLLKKSLLEEILLKLKIIKVRFSLQSCSQFILFLQRSVILVLGRHFCDPLVPGQCQGSDQSDARDGESSANERRVFSDQWLTAPWRPEPEHHLSESISGTTRFIPGTRGSRESNFKTTTRKIKDIKET